MKSTRLVALLVSGTVLLTGCGSTVQVTGTRALGGSGGGLDSSGLTVDGGSATELGAGSGAGSGSRSGSGPASAGGSSYGTGGAVGPGGVPLGRDSAPGATAGPQGSGTSASSSTTGPLQIGVLLTDTDSFKKATGVGESYTSLTREAIHAYIQQIVADGGAGGRKLTIIDHAFQYAAPSYDSEFQAACQDFTVDHHVGAVVYDGIVYNQNFNACLTKARVPVISMAQTGMTVGDRTDFANHPGMFTVGAVSTDRRLRSVLNKSLAGGYLHAGSKLGLFVEDCAYNLRVYANFVAPFLARNKVDVNRVDVDCGTGASDQGSGSAAAQSAVLRFQSAGVDSVVFLTNFENGLVYFFGAQASAQNYHPQYLLYHNQGCPLCLDAWSNFKDQLVKMRGFGALPIWDVTVPPAPPPAQAAVRRTCLANARRHGIPTTGQDHQAVMYDACDAVNLLGRALALSGGQGGTPSIQPAIESLGTSFVSTETLDGATRFGAGQHDGADFTAVSVYQAKCSCIAYVTQGSPIS